MLGMYGKKASMERQNSNGLIKNFKRECQSKNVSKALRITSGYSKSMRDLIISHVENKRKENDDTNNRKLEI